MAIAITCKSCGSRVNAPDKAAGKKARCPRCRELIAIPSGIEQTQPPPSRQLPSEDKTTDPSHPPLDKSPATSATPATNQRSKKRLLIAAVLLILIGLGFGGFWAIQSMVRGRQQAAAHEAVQTVLEKWKSGETTTKFQVGSKQISFFEPHFPLAGVVKPPKLLKYEISGTKTNDKGDHEVAVTLTFLAGSERRVYEVHFYDDGGSMVASKVVEGLGTTEEYARTLLRAWLDNWAVGEDAKRFKEQHPDCGGKMFTDILRAASEATGKRLVQYDIKGSQPIENGFKFSVTLIIDAQGTTQTRAVFYSVFRDRLLSEGLWTIIQM